MCFCAETLAGLGLSWISNDDNKTASGWQQVPVLINYLLNHSNQAIRSKWLIQLETKQVSISSEWTVESLAQLIRSKMYSFKEWNTMLLCTFVLAHM